MIPLTGEKGRTIQSARGRQQTSAKFIRGNSFAKHFSRKIPGEFVWERSTLFSRKKCVKDFRDKFTSNVKTIVRIS